MKKQTELRELPLWLKRLVPLVLFLVAMNTYLRDRILIFARVLRPKKYETFVFRKEEIEARKDKRARNLKRIS